MNDKKTKLKNRIYYSTFGKFEDGTRITITRNGENQDYVYLTNRYLIEEENNVYEIEGLTNERETVKEYLIFSSLGLDVDVKIAPND